VWGVVDGLNRAELLVAVFALPSLRNHAPMHRAPPAIHLSLKIPGLYVVIHHVMSAIKPMQYLTLTYSKPIFSERRGR